jgi:hypothetical protein
MAKAKSLADEFALLPDYEDQAAWHKKLRRDDPKLMAQIDTIIDEWLSGKKWRNKFPTRSHLAKALLPKIRVIHHVQSVTRYMADRPNGNS